MPSEHRARRTRRHLLIVIKVFVSLALLALLFSRIDTTRLWATARRASIVWLTAALGVYFVNVLVSTWRWHLLLDAQEVSMPRRTLLGSYLVATFFNNFLPSNIGGDVIRVRDSSKLTGSTTTSLAVVAIDRVLGLGALYVLALGAYLAAGPQLRGLAGARSALLALGVLFGILAYVFFKPGTAGRAMAALGGARFPWAQARFEQVQSAVHVYRQEVAAVWTAFAGSIA